MDTEAGKTSLSANAVSQVSKGTSTMPPPAPNKPLTAPAQTPQMIIGSAFFLFNVTPPVEIFSDRGAFYA